MFVHASVPLGVNVLYFAQKFVLAYEFLGDLVPRIAPALVANLQELSRLLGRLHHLPGLFQLIRHLLFAIHMQSRFEAGNGHRSVQPVRRDDDSRLKVLLFGKHLLVAFVWIGIVFVASFEVP